MREYKFRAYDRVENKMISFEELVERSSLYDFSDEFIDPFNEMIGEYESPRIYMQYTGLEDKNGKEIYEKDIIMGEDCDGVYFAKVEWSKTDAQFMIEAGKYFTDELSIYVDDVVVVGNVFEKPEILKEIKI